MAVAQRREVEWLSGQLARNRGVVVAILTLAENLKATAVDAILAKRDLELGFEVLTGRSPLFRRSHHGDRNRRKCGTGRALPGSASQIQESRAISVGFAADTTAPPICRDPFPCRS